MRSAATPFAWLTLLAWISWSAGPATLGACTSSNTDCTCTAEYAGQRRTLACGETACVGGTTVTCGDKDQLALGGACTVTAPPPEGPGFDAGGNPTPPPDRSCDDLRTYCSTSCTNPASVSADCQATASAGNPESCATWTLTNGVVCRP
ncbi:hypothetical protein [Pendulispora albinea]|uniref:Uncharacterized protein n=1 Tax=Pendulispora albinea TaxID=2741071 RepID=A0ABZ2M7H1_9BACT